jgi:hypothetical protein
MAEGDNAQILKNFSKKRVRCAAFLRAISTFAPACNQKTAKMAVFDCTIPSAITFLCEIRHFLGPVIDHIPVQTGAGVSLIAHFFVSGLQDFDF